MPFLLYSRGTALDTPLASKAGSDSSYLNPSPCRGSTCLLLGHIHPLYWTNYTHLSQISKMLFYTVQSYICVLVVISSQLSFNNGANRTRLTLNNHTLEYGIFFINFWHVYALAFLCAKIRRIWTTSGKSLRGFDTTYIRSSHRCFVDTTIRTSAAV